MSMKLTIVNLKPHPSPYPCTYDNLRFQSQQEQKKVDTKGSYMGFVLCLPQFKARKHGV